jgi:hypothetical protein
MAVPEALEQLQPVETRTIIEHLRRGSVPVEQVPFFTVGPERWLSIIEDDDAQRPDPGSLAVSALTHQAIDNVLLKVQQSLQGLAMIQFRGRCLKGDRRHSLSSNDGDEPALTYVDDAAVVLETPYLILGATGFGLYQVFDSQPEGFPDLFDSVILDEASQIQVPQALLSLIYGKGQDICSTMV